MRYHRVTPDVETSEGSPSITQVDAVAPYGPGDIVAGKYRVERVLGAGGMGIVLGGTHVGLGQAVAIKMMLPMALKHPEAVVRFEREARAAVRLRSEHVTRVTDVGTDRGMPYMVMELLEGRDLGDVLVYEGPLSPELAIDYLLQACDAIAEAHMAGIVHRDLKPKNLFLTRRADGRPLIKVLDFGISKVELPGEEMSLTRTTEVMGSPSYMSPEQLRSARAVDERTDIWALGAILFELLTGRVPFEAETVTELCAKVLQDPTPRVSTHRQDVPPTVDAVIHRCLAKRREDRFANVAELAKSLAAIRDGRGAALDVTVSATSVQMAAPAAPSRSPMLVALGALVLVAGVGVAWYFAQSGDGASVQATPSPALNTPPQPREEPLPTPSLAPASPAPEPRPEATPSAAPTPVVAPAVSPAQPAALPKKPTAAVKPTPQPTSDDLPTSRH